MIDNREIIGSRTKKIRSRRLVRATAWAMMGVMLAGCVQTVKTQALTKLDQLETGLKRGQSSKSDVLFLLGEPDGSGGAIFPTAAYGSDVWYYEASRSTLSSVRQKILLVYFKGGVFDGFMWFTNDADVSLQ